MVEFALAVAVLATLLVGMPVISRYHELQIATFEGARRLAFETAWRPPGATRPDTRAMREALFPSVVDSDQPVAERLSSSDSLSPTPGPAGQAMRVLLAPFKAVARLASGCDSGWPGRRHLPRSTAQFCGHSGRRWMQRSRGVGMGRT